MRFYRAWYVRERDATAVDLNFPEWVVRATDEQEARLKVLSAMQRDEPDHGYCVALSAFDDEDAGIAAFATARQQDQAIP
jgi:hypothetical protein